MYTSNTALLDTATNEWQDIGKFHTQGKSDIAKNEAITNLLSSTLILGLATATPYSYNTDKNSISNEAAKTTLSIYSYSPENMLNEKLEQTLNKLKQHIFEYIAKVVSINNAAGSVTLETTVGGEQVYFDWELSNLPFTVNRFSSIKIFGYQNYKGIEKVSFLQIPEEDFDDHTLEKLANLSYVKSSHP